MALIATNVRLSNGRTIPSAYVKVEVTGHTSKQCSLLLEVWDNAQDRAEFDPLDRLPMGIQNPPDIASSNPLEYAYVLLTQQPGYEDATPA